MNIGKPKKVHEDEPMPEPMEKTFPRPLPERREVELVPARRITPKQPKRVA